MPKVPMTCSFPAMRTWIEAAWPGKYVGAVHYPVVSMDSGDSSSRNRRTIKLLNPVLRVAHSLVVKALLASDE